MRYRGSIPLTSTKLNSMSNDKNKHSILYECIKCDAPELTKDLALWIESNKSNENWKFWSSERLVGYVLKYISEIYGMYPESLNKGDYSMSYPLFEDSGINDEGANLTEFEIFCYNIIAECVRIDQNYLT